MKRARGLVVESQGIEWGTEVFVMDELVIIEAEDEEAARLECVSLGGQLKCREWFVTSWADAPDE